MVRGTANKSSLPSNHCVTQNVTKLLRLTRVTNYIILYIRQKIMDITYLLFDQKKNY